MSLAITRQPTLWTRTNARQTLTRLMYTSRLAFSSCKMVRHLLAHQIKELLPFRKTYTLRRINLHLSMDLLHHNGVLLNPNSRLRVLLHQPYLALDGIDLLRRSGTPGCPHSS